MNRRPIHRPTGFTLVELVTVMAIIAVLGVLAAPSMSGLLARERLKRSAHLLQADVALARQWSQQRGRVVHLSFRPGSSWCYALSLDAPVDCLGSAGGTAVLKRVSGEGQAPVMLLRADPMAVDGTGGLSPTPGAQAVLATPDGKRLSVRLSLPGRSSVCAPGPAVAGTLPCAAPPHEAPMP